MVGSVALTDVAVASDPNPSSFGEAVTLTATVTPTPPASGLPSAGTVTFFDHGVALGGTVAYSSDGITTLTATLTTSAIAAGTASITATYSGDANFDTATSPATIQQFRPRGHERRSAGLAGRVELRAGGGLHRHREPHRPRAGTPTGTVTVTSDASPLLQCTITLSNGTGSCSLPYAGDAGNRLITATYGAIGFAGSSGDKAPKTASAISNNNWRRLVEKPATPTTTPPEQTPHLPPNKSSVSCGPFSHADGLVCPANGFPYTRWLRRHISTLTPSRFWPTDACASSKLM